MVAVAGVREGLQPDVAATLKAHNASLQKLFTKYCDGSSTPDASA